MIKKFKVYRCIREDMFLPIVWIKDKDSEEVFLKKASLVKISKGKKKIFAYAYPIESSDKNKFNEAYNRNRKTDHYQRLLFEVKRPVVNKLPKPEITGNDRAIFISRYYSDKLDLKRPGTSGKEEVLEIIQPGKICLWYYYLRGAFMHPDFSIRTASYIAFGSLLLGFIGLIQKGSKFSIIFSVFSLFAGFFIAITLTNNALRKS